MPPSQTSSKRKKFATLLLGVVTLTTVSAGVPAHSASAATANICISSKVVNSGSDLVVSRWTQTVTNGCASTFRVQVQYWHQVSTTNAYLWTACKTLHAVGKLTYKSEFNGFTRNGDEPTGKWRTC